MQHDFQDKLRFLRISNKTQENLKEITPVLGPQLPQILEEFYAHIFQWPELQAKFPNPMAVSHAKAGQGEHWKTMFSGQFNQQYFENITVIGKTHEKKAIEPQYYMGGYCFALTRIVETLSEHYAKDKNGTHKLAESINAVLKSVFLDMDLALGVYNETVKETADRHLATSLGEVLDNVSKLDHHVGTVAASVEESTANIREILSASGKVEGNVKAVGENASQMSANMHSVASATEMMTTSINTIASAMEEMECSLKEVSQSASRASSVASTAASKAEDSKETVTNLGQAAKEIGKIVDVIREIASQTNLLALNATIEAANAGQAGRGFAVVANEVKELAKQSAEATKTIQLQVKAIQDNTNTSIESINSISQVIDEMNQINHSIANAVSEQTSTSNEIAMNISQTAHAAAEVSKNISDSALLSTHVADRVVESQHGFELITRNLKELSQGADEMARTASASASKSSQITEGLKKTLQASQKETAEPKTLGEPMAARV